MPRHFNLGRGFMVRVAGVLLLAGLPLAWAGSAPAGGEMPPNFVLLLADDLGYGDLGSYGHPSIRTPHLDRLAQEGLKLTQFYAPASLCTPSRAGLLTGKLPARIGMLGERGVLFPDSSGGLAAAEVTLAEALEGLGYATALVGKWHLGHLPEFLPARQGFDQFFGLPYSNDMRPENEHWDYARENFPPLPLMEGEQVIERSPDQSQLTARFTARAIRFIEQQRQRPFFLFLSYTAPHAPLYPAPEWAGKSRRGLYGDVVEELDASVGAIVAALDRLGLGERTLVLFTSDNGPWGWRGLDGGSAGLLRGAKGSPWEGGFRVPAIVRMPGTAPANATSAALVSGLDLFPTFLGMAGGDPAAHPGLDGLDATATFTQAAQVREQLHYYGIKDLVAYRHGPWKLFLRDPNPWSDEITEDDLPLLFHLERDPSEGQDLAKEHPEAVARLTALAEQHIAQLGQVPSRIEGILPEHQESYAAYQARQQAPPTRPNILWLVAEDLSPYLPPFGDSTIRAPNLERLAREGVRYGNVYSVSGVCSPSRAALITGMYPTSIGAHHMRTTHQQPEARAIGLIDYEVVPPPQVRMVSELLRREGYYAVNNVKEDFQFHSSALAWDESSLFAHWRNRPEGQPFFAAFHFGVTHEGQLWSPATVWNLRYGRAEFPPDRNKELVWTRFPEGEQKPLLIPDDLQVPIPPYLPDTEAVRKEVRRMYSNIVEMDGHVGRILQQLEEDGLLESTIVVWFSDHGGPLPRQKRTLYDSGLRAPLIIRYPGKRRAGERDDQLLSFVDFAPTLLSWAGIPVPGHMQGQAFDGPFAAPRPRRHVFAAADRFDGHYDLIRAARDLRYKYLKNYRPERGYYLPLAYREQMASMRELLRLRDAGGLNAAQSQWFRERKPAEELFDTWNDPHELRNLAGDPAHAKKLAELRAACAAWMEEAGDLGFVPEPELIEGFWPGGRQPITAAPEVRIEDGKLRASSATEGASIGHRWAGDRAPGQGWRPYLGPLELESGARIELIAHRLGYAPSAIVHHVHP